MFSIFCVALIHTAVIYAISSLPAADGVQLAIAPLALGALKAAPAVLGLLAPLLGGKQTAQQGPLQTPEQLAARQQLLDFAQTGKFGDFQAGAEVPLQFGDFAATGLEQQGLSSLGKLLSEGIPEQFRLGTDALQDILATSPEQVEAQFSPFKAQVERQIKESDEALKRRAAFGQNLFSTDTIQQLGDIGARGNEALTAELGRLTSEDLNRRLAAVPLAFQAGEAQQGAGLQQIAASQQFGGLTRQLNDAAIKARDAELLRRREELKLPITAASTVAGTPAQFGVESVSQSPFQDLLGLVGKVSGQAVSDAIFKRQFPNEKPRKPSVGIPNQADLIRRLIDTRNV